MTRVPGDRSGAPSRPPTVVVGTAGHIDHGKTTLLRALTGIDADRLPEERARGMTLDVGYAHLALPDGTELDFVDVPGHDRLVGNMLVGAGEVDAWLLVVAADDGPRAQTLEHLELLDALGLALGVAVVSKADAVGSERVGEVRSEVEQLLARAGFQGTPMLALSATTGEGLAELRAALRELRERVLAARGWPGGPGEVMARSEGLVARLAVDRVFSIRGRGAVVTGTLRGGPLRPGASLRVLPEEKRVRVREVQVHGRRLGISPSGGRVALNLAGVETAALRRGQVLVPAEPAAPADHAGLTATDRLLVALLPPARLPGGRASGRSDAPSQALFPPREGMAARMHIGTDQADAVIVRPGRGAAPLIGSSVLAGLRLDRSVAAAPGDRFVLRLPSPAGLAAGGIVLDTRPPRGPSRRRVNAERLELLAGAILVGPAAGSRKGWGGETPSTTGPSPGVAHLELHGLLPDGAGSVRLAPDVTATLVQEASAGVGDHHGTHPADVGMPAATLRAALARSVRRRVTTAGREADEAAEKVLEAALADGLLVREGERVRLPERPPTGPSAEASAARDRLVQLLGVPASPPLEEACRAAGCTPEDVRALEAEGAIVRLEADLAWSRKAFDDLAAQAVRLARHGPLTPARLRDATGTSRKYVMALLEELDRRAVLRRTPAGHVPGPRAPSERAVGH